jgi:anti-anti-sigma regulatory factor
MEFDKSLQQFWNRPFFPRRRRHAALIGNVNGNLEVFSRASSDESLVSTIVLSGRLTIQRATEILSLCRATIAAGPVRVDWTAAKAIDTAVLQILISLSREPGVEFTQPSSSVRETVSLAGLQGWLDDLTWSRE